MEPATTLLKRQSNLSNTDPSQSNMPDLWVFLIIVLAILLGLVVGTSLIMHLIQRRQRHSLERRIANGEVDLEALGIKRLNVPQPQIDKMPSYTFNIAGNPVASPAKAAKTENRRQSALFSQTTCAICLDDFEENVTTVRELPCNHVFHPECIDPFLRHNSSLCPVCKRSALPTGFCPVPVTNVMVRRERLTRRMRDNRTNPMQGYLGNRLSHVRRSVMAPQIRNSTVRVPSPVPEVASPPPANQTDTELGDMPPVTTSGTTSETPDADPAPAPAPTTDSTPSAAPASLTVPTTVTTPAPGPPSPVGPVPPEIAMQGAEARREWRRQQLARQHSNAFDQQGDAARRIDESRPWYRRILGLS